MTVALQERLIDARIIAILRGDYRETAVPIVSALAAGGIRVVEVTMNSPGVFDLIATLTAHFGDDLLVGGGTVRTPEQVQRSVDAGARFIVSPDTHPPVIEAALTADIVPLPGALTPSEITTAVRTGATLVKLFPASQVAPSYLRQILAPLDSVKLFPTGGITLENARAYIEAGAAGLGIGSALVPSNFDDSPSAQAALTGRARQFVEAVR